MTKEELLWQVDEYDNPLGSVERKKAHAEGITHRAVLVVIQDGEEKYRLQKRAANKEQYPGHWTVAASGHVQYGETYEEAAARETQEEINASVETLRLVNRLRIPTAEETQWVGVVIATLSGIEKISANTEEVADTIAVTLDELRAMLETEQFTPAARVVLEKLIQDNS